MVRTRLFRNRDAVEYKGGGTIKNNPLHSRRDLKGGRGKNIFLDQRERIRLKGAIGTTDEGLIRKKRKEKARGTQKREKKKNEATNRARNRERGRN